MAIEVVSEAQPELRDHGEQLDNDEPAIPGVAVLSGQSDTMARPVGVTGYMAEAAA